MYNFTDIDEFKSKLAGAGYTDLKNKTTKKVIVFIKKTDDRVGTLEDIAKKLKNYGGFYNDKSNESSIGRTEFNGGYAALVKIKGGGGSGAGSSLTELVESAQCVYNAAVYANVTFSKTNLKKNTSSYDISDTLDNVLNNLSEDWIFSSKIVAQKLKKKFPNKKYVHHRGSNWVNKLETHWKVLNKQDGSPFSNLNKWSPADIWMVSQKGSGIDFTATKSIKELNSLLMDCLDSGDIVGVSLKKVTSENPNYKVLNVTSERPTWKYVKTTTGLQSFFKSGDGYLMFDGGKAQFRKFGSTWQGELKGKNANMGKVSGGPIATIVKDIAKVTMVNQRELMGRTEKDIKRFHQWYSSIPYHTKMTYTKFAAEVAKKDMNWFISKAMTTQLISIIESLSTMKKNKFSSALVNYAASESELSGPYVKIY